MKDKKWITWVIAVGVVLTGAVMISCAALNLDSGSGGYTPSPAPAAPC